MSFTITRVHDTDDDGSGTTGTIHNDAWLQAQLDTIDAVFAKIYPAAQNFRLTLSSGVSVPTSDVTAATTLYFSPHSGRRCVVFDGSGNATVLTSAEISIAVPATTSQMYDVFVYNNGGVLTLELLAWTNDTTRATAIVKTGGVDAAGVYTKSGDSTRRYVGSFRTTTVSGQTEDSLSKRLVWNYYNRVPRAVRRLDPAASWTYTTLTWRQANANTANQIAVVVGVAEVPISLQVDADTSNSVGGATVYVYGAIGENSTTTPHASCFVSPVPNTGAGAFSGGPHAHLDTFPAAGYSFYAWLEQATAGTGTTTFYGTNAGSANSGLSGSIHG